MPWHRERKIKLSYQDCSLYNIQQFRISFEKSTSTTKLPQLRTCFNANEWPGKMGT